LLVHRLPVRRDRNLFAVLQRLLQVRGGRASQPFSRWYVDAHVDPRSRVRIRIILPA
jgi:hypothetical protein